MVLVVEDGSGIANAESYESVASADTYHAAYGDPSDWSSATTDAKETALRTATQALDALFGLAWRGIRWTTTQALDWPRTNVVNRDGFLLDVSPLPDRLRRATSILALKSIQGTTLLPDLSAGSTGIVSESKGAGKLSKSITYGPAGKTANTTYQLAEALIADLINGSGALRVDVA